MPLGKVHGELRKARRARDHGRSSLCPAFAFPGARNASPVPDDCSRARKGRPRDPGRDPGRCPGRPGDAARAFTGLLWLLGLVSGKGGRQYVTKISDQAMRAASVMLQGACPGGDQKR